MPSPREDKKSTQNNIEGRRKSNLVISSDMKSVISGALHDQISKMSQLSRTGRKLKKSRTILINKPS
jgi:hypothetical protein